MQTPSEAGSAASNAPSVRDRLDLIVRRNLPHEAPQGNRINIPGRSQVHLIPDENQFELVGYLDVGDGTVTGEFVLKESAFTSIEKQDEPQYTRAPALAYNRHKLIQSVPIDVLVETATELFGQRMNAEAFEGSQGNINAEMIDVRAFYNPVEGRTYMYLAPAEPVAD